MNLMHIKLKFGDELIANVTDEKVEEGMPFFLFDNPVQVKSTGEGIHAREWLYFSEVNCVWIPSSDIIYMNTTNEEGATYFNRILEMRRIQDEDAAHREMQFSEEEIEEAKEMISVFFQSHNSTKH